MISLLAKFFGIALMLALPGCSIKKQPKSAVSTSLTAMTAIHLVDRNGTTETISDPERLEAYKEIDFLRSQPYSKVLRIFGHSRDGKPSALITSYYENGELCQYLEVIKHRAYGKYREWYDNGQLSSEALVIGGNPDITPAAQSTWLFEGLCKAWNSHGDLTAEISYSKGKLQGPSRYYHANGQLWKSAVFCDGKLSGISDVFYDDGTLLQRLSYKNGELDGPSYRYWRDGRRAAEETYVQGLLQEGLYWDVEGCEISKIKDGEGFRALFGESQIHALHAYYRGVEEGEIRQLNSKGEVVRRWHVKDGIKQGIEVIYYANSNRPKIELTWSLGKLQGPVRTWYPNGEQESLCEMGDNFRNGLLTAWYEDGSLMLLEEYERDHLKKGEYYRRGERIPISEVLDGDGLAYLHNSEGYFLKKISYRGGKPIGEG